MMMALIDLAADLVSPPNTWRQAAVRLPVVVAMFFGVVWLGQQTGLPTTFGFVVGEAFGALLVYSNMRRN